MRTRVAVALSGGVDSAVAALLLVQQGYDVLGLMMRLWAEEDAENPRANRCCSPQGVEDARRVAQLLDIPFYLVNYAREFKAAVVDPFVGEYAAGRTPNPCLACNRHIKFGRLLERARSLDADFLATGHYARIVQGEGRYRLLKGADRRKDQSYVLYMLGQRELGQVLFPLGELTKDEVRARAVQAGLPVGEKPESQEICFVGDEGYHPFLSRQAPATVRPGPIVDAAGRVLGQHQGLAFYTVGQRHGLGIATGEPLYVLQLDPARNALVVGPEEALGQRELLAGQVSFVAGDAPPVSRVTAKVRYKAPESPGTLLPLDEGRVRLVFDQPQRAITPGQAVVFYQGEEVLGGGIIERTRIDAEER
jgi:tRNA-specific 2-thiouridylase